MNDSGPVADLHVHTTASDGTLTIETLPRAARAADVSWVAVTDHDRLHPTLDAPVVERDGISLIRGLELRVDAGSLNVDLLAYGVSETPALTVELERIQRDRIERGEAIIDRVESRLDVDLDLTPERGLGRPHVARAIEASSAPYDFQRAFDELIGAGKPCYVPRSLPTFERAVELLGDAAAVVSLAHPFRYHDLSTTLALAPKLDAVERYYPYGWSVDSTPIDRVVADAGLLVTGGSDAHDDQLGRAGLSESDFEPILARIRRTQA
ncbi:PHP domain-containing protein [Haloferacaceae archaeon DSL9]